MCSKYSQLLLFIVCCNIVVAAVFSCTSKEHKKATKSDQYFVQGKVLYEVNCSNCHQKNGTGLGRLYPPIAKSDFLDNHFEEVICLIKNGKEGELIVNGTQYNMAMKGITKLTDLEIAEIVTYIYNAWGGQREAVEVKEVSSVLAGCSK
ncbi:MAG: cytochrome c [Bacteroidia bacterium]|nr:cytochrome c [Bacteroidia bacterium]